MPKIITKNANKKLGKNKLKKVGPSSWLSKKIYSEKQAVGEIFGHIRQVRIFWDITWLPEKNGIICEMTKSFEQ